MFAPTYLNQTAYLRQYYAGPQGSNAASRTAMLVTSVAYWERVEEPPGDYLSLLMELKDKVGAPLPPPFRCPDLSRARWARRRLAVQSSQGPGGRAAVWLSRALKGQVGAPPFGCPELSRARWASSCMAVQAVWPERRPYLHVLACCTAAFLELGRLFETMF
jgi:hypothetical protein